MKNKINKTGNWTIFLIGFILTFVKGNVTVEQQQIMADEGSSVTLKCIVTSNDKQTLSWIFNDNIINTNRKVLEEDQIVTKYTLSNTTVLILGRKTTTYNLKIRNVLSTDDGVYTCRVIFVENATKSVIILAVKYLNENPFVNCQLLFTSNTSTQYGSNHQMEKTRGQTQQLNISCRAHIGKNIFLNITIMKSVHHNNDLIPVYFVTEEQFDAVDGVNVNYLVNVTDDLDGWQFWCVVHQSKMLQPVNCSTPLLMKPRVKIVKLIDSEQFRCEVESYPDASFFQWIICEKEIENVTVEECRVLNSTSRNVTLMNIGGKADELVLKCETQNAVGTGRGNLNITTHTKPTDMLINGNTEPTDMPTTRHTATTRNKMRVDSHLEIWSIAGGLILLFCLALTIFSLYFGIKQLRRRRNLMISVNPSMISLG
ncbi:uncharacterized protein LOC117115016 [Anneissia japonica]|uniref:uncharacterized protein LOC117115016 n=1 Tax=Anneissia japonica TaxID=1529436 RepID=UPI0014256DF5|nr:uncharacterized protein LOC117115016 [Anneissia japonica]